MADAAEGATGATGWVAAAELRVGRFLEDWAIPGVRGALNAGTAALVAGSLLTGSTAGVGETPALQEHRSIVAGVLAEHRQAFPEVDGVVVLDVGGGSGALAVLRALPSIGLGAALTSPDAVTMAARAYDERQAAAVPVDDSRSIIVPPLLAAAPRQSASGGPAPRLSAEERSLAAAVTWHELNHGTLLRWRTPAPPGVDRTNWLEAAAQYTEVVMRARDAARRGDDPLAEAGSAVTRALQQMADFEPRSAGWRTVMNVNGGQAFAHFTPAAYRQAFVDVASWGAAVADLDARRVFDRSIEVAGRSALRDGDRSLLRELYDVPAVAGQSADAERIVRLYGSGAGSGWAGLDSAGRIAWSGEIIAQSPSPAAILAAVEVAEGIRTAAGGDPDPAWTRDVRFLAQMNGVAPREDGALVTPEGAVVPAPPAPPIGWAAAWRAIDAEAADLATRRAAAVGALEGELLVRGDAAAASRLAESVAALNRAENDRVAGLAADPAKAAEHARLREEDGRRYNAAMTVWADVVAGRDVADGEASPAAGPRDRLGDLGRPMDAAAARAVAAAALPARGPDLRLDLRADAAALALPVARASLAGGPYGRAVAGLTDPDRVAALLDGTVRARDALRAADDEGSLALRDGLELGRRALDRRAAELAGLDPAADPARMPLVSSAGRALEPAAAGRPVQAVAAGRPARSGRERD